MYNIKKFIKFYIKNFSLLFVIISLINTPLLAYAQTKVSKGKSFLLVNGGDIPTNHWAAESVILAIDRYKILSGYPGQKTFDGEKIPTRFEVAASIYQAIISLQALGVKIGPAPNHASGEAGGILTPMSGPRILSKFEKLLRENGGDLERTHWASNAIKELVDRYEFMSGFPDNQFKGFKNITRYEMANALYIVLKALEIEKDGIYFRTNRALKPNGGDLEPSHQAFRSVKAVLSHGIMNLEKNQFFNGNNNLSRYDLAYSLARLGDLAERHSKGESIYAEDKQFDLTKERIALVVGNSNYQPFDPLPNPVNDAVDITEKLKKLGFYVIHKENIPTRQEFLKIIQNEFGSLIQPKGTTLFYYAGHSMEISNENYLIPTKAVMKSEAQKEDQSLSLEIILRELTDKGSHVNILFLDSCRDNPFSRNRGSSSNTQRGLKISPGTAYQGLTQLNQYPLPVGTFINYATMSGTTASDGSGRNGLFTQELLNVLEIKDLTVESVADLVKENVKNLSINKQIPEYKDNLNINFIFNRSFKPIIPEIAKENQSQVSNSLGMKFVNIVPGSFMMGSLNNEEGRHKNETQHQVTLTQGYYMQTTEVTQGQWQAVMGNNPSHFNGDSNLPVENVSWEEVQLFIAALNRRGEGSYRLPTEAEWEYAARSGSSTRYNLGDSEGSLTYAGWYDGNSNDRTHPVGEKQPNGWGLHDMHGNVLEWVQDWYGEYPSEAVTNPFGPSTGSYRVFRGGSWANLAQNARSSYRSGSSPVFRDYNLGFRLVRVQ